MESTLLSDFGILSELKCLRSYLNMILWGFEFYNNQ